MMSDQADNLSNLIETFGLTDEESRLYLYFQANFGNKRRWENKNQG